MNIKKTLAVLVMFSSSAITAQAVEMVAADQSISTGLCMTALSGNRVGMQDEIKDSGLTKRYVTNNVACNDVNIVAFVQRHGKNADAMLKMLGTPRTRVSITDVAQNRVLEK